MGHSRNLSLSREEVLLSAQQTDPPRRQMEATKAAGYHKPNFTALRLVSSCNIPVVGVTSQCPVGTVPLNHSSVYNENKWTVI